MHINRDALTLFIMWLLLIICGAVIGANILRALI